METARANRYLTVVHLPTGGLLLYSALFGRLVEIDEHHTVRIRQLIERGDGIEVNDSITRLLLEQGMLVPNEFDELAWIQQKYDRAKFRMTGQLGLTICPTLSCNFRCTYCYQEHPAGHMSSEIRNRLVEFVRDVRKPEVLGVTWFGGEPLAALRVIEDVSSRLAAVVDSFSANIVTNGSLLTPGASARLVAIGVTSAQITLDGPRRIHDSRRPGVDGRPTFEKIVSNIKASDSALRISIRVNVDERNVDSCPDLLTELKQAGLRGRVAVYFAPVAPYTEICADVVDHCVQGRDWARIESQLNYLVSEAGFGAPTLPEPRSNVCLADRAGDFVVVPSGLVFNCWNDVTDERRAVFDLATMSQSSAMATEMRKWAAWSAFQFEECVNCDVLPLCLGGCPSEAMRLNRGACGTLKHNLETRLLTYYLQQRTGEQSEQSLSGIPSVLRGRVTAIATGGATKDVRSRLEDRVTSDLRSWTARHHAVAAARSSPADQAPAVATDPQGRRSLPIVSIT
jgi:uncharacterized protein